MHNTMTSKEIFDKIRKDFEIFSQKFRDRESLKQRFDEYAKSHPDPDNFVRDIQNKIFHEEPDEIDEIYKGMSDEEILKMDGFPEDILKIQQSFSEYGFPINCYFASSVWSRRSEKWFAGWLALEENPFLECFVYLILEW